MKHTLFIIAIIAIAFTISCGGTEMYHEGETTMGTHTKTMLFESTLKQDVSAHVELTDPLQFDLAELYVNGEVVGNFNAENVCIFSPSKFGEVPCEIVTYDLVGESYEETGRYIDTLTMNIETFFIGAHPDVGHQLKELPENGKISFFSGSVPRGDSDICFRMVARVPVGKNLVIDYNVEALDDYKAWTGNTLDVHFRGADYSSRNDLYTPPDEALYHIDPEVDKWIYDSVTLEHGVHVLYVAPSVLHDLSLLRVYVSGDYSSTVESYHRSIDWENSGLLPEGVSI